MKIEVDARLRDEARAHALRFGCEDCASFDPERRACALGYPIADHADVDLATARHVLFCKAFELA